jgi:hypothetical protein
LGKHMGSFSWVIHLRWAYPTEAEIPVPNEVVDSIEEEERASTAFFANKKLLALTSMFFNGVHQLRVFGIVNKIIAHTCLNYYLLQKIMRRNFYRKVTVWGLDPASFAINLKLSASVLGGSFVLECVTGEDFPSPLPPLPSISTLTVIVLRRSVEAVEQYIRSYNYELDENHANDVKSNLWNMHSPLRQYINHKTMKRIGMHIMSVHTPHIHYKEHPDFTICPVPQRVRDAIALYDFTFLMNHFDGRYFHICHAQDIVTRTGYFNVVGNEN